MKNLLFLLRRLKSHGVNFGKLLAICCLFIDLHVYADDNVVNVYNWSDYMPDKVIKQFEQTTGIKVNYSEYDGNETMYAKLKASPTVGYDVIVPSDYFVDKMRKEGMLQKLDKQQLTNFKNLDPSLLNRPYDPDNNYSVPYLWGTVGIVINDKYVNPNEAMSWADFWRPQYHDQLLMMNEMRMVFAVALITLHYSINDTNPEHIKQAYLRLVALMPNIKLFNSDAADNLFIDEDAIIGMNNSGDTFRDMPENPHLKYIYPADGFQIWIDNMAIPKGAPHLKNAYKFINFILQPDIAKEISLEQRYSSPNKLAQQLMPLAWRNNPIFNPSPAILKRGQSQLDLGPADAIYAHYWEMLKMGS